MKTIYKSYIFKIYPNKEQKELLVKHFGACRFVFNCYLNIRKENYLNNKTSLNYYDNANDLTQLKKDEQFVWLKEINSQSLQSSSGSKVGIDTGIKDLAILSNGKIYKNIKSLKINLKKLKYNQRLLSKKQKGSNSRLKQKQVLAKIYERVSNIRKDYLHKVSTEIIKNHDVICIEDLAVKNMMKNHCLAQAFSDVNLGTFYNMLEYKANWNDKTVVKIDRFFPSSKICNICNYINQDLTLKDREWTCPNCNSKYDRDLNASINIKKQGLNILSGSGIESDIKQKRGEALPIGKSMKHETNFLMSIY